MKSSNSRRRRQRPDIGGSSHHHHRRRHRRCIYKNLSSSSLFFLFYLSLGSLLFIMFMNNNNNGGQRRHFLDGIVVVVNGWITTTKITTRLSLSSSPSQSPLYVSLLLHQRTESLLSSSDTDTDIDTDTDTGVELTIGTTEATTAINRPPPPRPRPRHAEVPTSKDVEGALSSLARTTVALLRTGNEELAAKLLFSESSNRNSNNDNNHTNSSIDSDNNDKTNIKRSLLQKTFDAYDVCKSGTLSFEEAQQLFHDLARSIVTEIATNGVDNDREIDDNEKDEEDENNERKRTATKKKKEETKKKKQNEIPTMTNSNSNYSVAQSHARRVLNNEEEDNLDTISRVATKLLLLADVNEDGKLTLPELKTLFDTVQEATSITTTTPTKSLPVVHQTFPQPLRALAGSLQLLPPTELTTSQEAANVALNYNVGVPGDDHTLRRVELKGLCNTGLDLSIIGLGRSADASTYYIPELSIVFDAGIHIKSLVPRTVLLTHGHRDHILALPVHAAAMHHNNSNSNNNSNNKNNNSKTIKTKILTPQKISKLVRHYLLSEAQLNYGDETQTEEQTIQALGGEFDIVGVQDGDEILLPKSSYSGSPTPIGIEVFHAPHKRGVPSVSYGIYTQKSKLKLEYSNLSKQEIGQLIRNNKKNDKNDRKLQLTELYNEGLLFYTGDTTIDLLRNRWKDILSKYKTIIHEVTFIASEGQSSSTLDTETKRKGHTHYIQLHPWICAFPDTTFVCVHWSLQYTKSDIINFFQRQYGGVPSNVILWI